MSETVNKIQEHLSAGVHPLSKALKEIMDAAQKSVCIELDDQTLTAMKENNYKLCFAKMVGDTYNVVWQSYKDYLNRNTFSWIPEYQIFGTNSFRNSYQVDVSITPKRIGLGQTVTLNKNGSLSDAFTAGNQTALNVDNEYGLIHVGVNQLSTGINGEQVATPIYVSPKCYTIGHAELEPKEEIMVWFEQRIETGTMFSESRSIAQKINLTYRNSAKVAYNVETGWKEV